MCLEEIACHGERSRSASFIGGFKVTGKIMSYFVSDSESLSLTALFSISYVLLFEL